MICECYKLNGPQGSAICFGTKECEACTCDGNKNKCNFNYFPKDDNDFETIWNIYTEANTNYLVLKTEKTELMQQLEQVSLKLNKWAYELEKATDVFRKFKDKIDYDKLRTAVLDHIADSIPSYLFDLISDKIHTLDDDELFDIARQQEIDFSKYMKGK